MRFTGILMTKRSQTNVICVGPYGRRRDDTQQRKNSQYKTLDTSITHVRTCQSFTQQPTWSLSSPDPWGTGPTGHPEWKFLCINGEKYLQTIWVKLKEDYKDFLYLNCTPDSMWNTEKDEELQHALTRAEEKRLKDAKGCRETIVKERFWRLWPDVITYRPPTETKSGVFSILEFKFMSDVTDQL